MSQTVSLPGTALGLHPARRLRRPSLAPLRRFATPLLLVALWQAGSILGAIPARTLAAPSTIAVSAWSLLASGALGHHLAVSLARVSIGMGLGVLTWHVILPGALPAGRVGLRTSLSVAWLSLVIAEQINADAGIG